MESMGQQIENTLWFELGDPPTVATLDDLLEGVQGWWKDNVKPITSSRVAVREYVATSMESATAPQSSITGDLLDVGANTPNPMPLGTTLTVSFRTAFRGRSFRGRNYVVGLTEDQVDGNSALAGTVTAWLEAYQALLPAALATGWRWVVVSRYSGIDPTTKKPIPRVEGLHTPVTNVVVVDEFIDSQRRRLTTRGN
jgi:hypothetical protein